MLVDPGNVGLALDGQIVLRWRFLFPAFFWPVRACLASAEIFRQARRSRHRILAARCARGLPGNFPPSEDRGRREDRVRAAPAVSCAIVQRTRTRAYRSSGEHPAFPAQWLYGLYRDLPGERLSCHRRLMDRSAKLDASVAASGPHDFAVRVSHARQSRHPRPSHLTAQS